MVMTEQVAAYNLCIIKANVLTELGSDPVLN